MSRSVPLLLVAELSEPERALLADIEAGFTDYHLGRGHPLKTPASELALVQEFARFAGMPPWRWTFDTMNRFSAGLARANTPLETMRRKQGSVRRFLDYARAPGYPWDARCFALTGEHIPQVCVAENTLCHQYGAPTSKRRRFTSEELLALFDHVGLEIERARSTSDELARSTHYAMLNFALGTGARAQEMAYGDLPDLREALTPAIATYSPFEDFYVRFGKRHDGGPPRQRSIVATDVFANAFHILAWYLEHIRPQVARPASPPAIFLAHDGQRFRPASISEIFYNYRVAIGLSEDLTLHCFRHTFTTILREHDFRLNVTSKLLGHESEASTVIYDHMAPDFVRAQIIEHAQARERRSKQWKNSRGAYVRT